MGGQGKHGLDLGGAERRLEGAAIGAFFRRRDAEVGGVRRHELDALVATGAVERIGRGLYRRAAAEITEDYSLALVAARAPRVVFCLLTALRYHGIGTQLPADVWIALPHRARVPRVPELRLRVVRFVGQAVTELGIDDSRFEGVAGRITSPARTIVDCFRFERIVGADVALEALDDALRRRITTVGELARLERRMPSRRLAAHLDARSI